MKEDLSRHFLVPTHEVLSPDAKRDLLERLHIEEAQLPKIGASDPQAMLIEAKPGQVLRITRKSPTAGRSVYYRLVVGEVR